MEQFKKLIKIILIIIIIAGIAGLAYVGYGVYVVSSIISEKNTELEGLKEETAQIIAGLDTTKYQVISQDCRDVELRNECLVIIQTTGSEEEIKSQLNNDLNTIGFQGGQDNQFVKNSQKFDDKEIKLVYESTSPVDAYTAGTEATAKKVTVYYQKNPE
jgi:hypothetical protein